MRAELRGIFICTDKGMPMNSVPYAVAAEGMGLRGDRYYANKGSWIEKGETEHKKKRNVTIMAAEDLLTSNVEAGTEFSMADTRRNLLTIGINPLELVGKQFEIGKAVFVGIEHAVPCDRPDRLSGKKGFELAFKGRGGLNAVILKTGIIEPLNIIHVAAVWF